MTRPSLSSPGWFGKLPGAGDFAHRRMPHALRTVWDDWLHDGLADLRARHQGWVESYLTAPVWCFLLAPGVADDSAWMGAMAPSVDRIGRYYPIAVFAPLEGNPSDWWKAAQQVLLQALEDDANAEHFERLIAAVFAHVALDNQNTDTGPHLPGPGRTAWMAAWKANIEPTMEMEGLPVGPMFDRLFDMNTAAASVEGGA